MKISQSGVAAGIGAVVMGCASPPQSSLVEEEKLSDPKDSISEEFQISLPEMMSSGLAVDSVFKDITFEFPIPEQPSAMERHPAHRVPPQMTRAVEFWTSVKTEIHDWEIVLHNRDTLEVLAVVSLQEDYEKLSPEEFAKKRSKAARHSIYGIKNAARKLAGGKEPESELEIDLANRANASYQDPKEHYIDIYRQRIMIRPQVGLKESVAEGFQRSGKYLELFYDVMVEGHGMLREEILLPGAESLFLPKATSWAGAGGIWQIMPSTAKALDLRLDKQIDERHDPGLSADAAARYISESVETFDGNRALAILSYNTGTGLIETVLKKIGQNPEDASIVDVSNYFKKFPKYFAQEQYYAQFLANVEIYLNAPKYFKDLERETPVELDRYSLGRPILAGRAASALGLEIEELASYNPAFTEAVIQGGMIPANYPIKFPSDNPERLAGLIEAENSAIEYKVADGDNLGKIASRFESSVEEIAELNGIRGHLIRIGQMLLIPPMR